MKRYSRRLFLRRAGMTAAALAVPRLIEAAGFFNLAGFWKKGGGISVNYFGSGSDGDVTISSDTALASSTGADDTGVVIKHYNSLTINAGVSLSPQHRVRAMVIYVKGNCTINGTLSVTARGASAAPAEDCVLFRVPDTGGGGASGAAFSGFPDEDQGPNGGTKKYGPTIVGSRGGDYGNTGNDWPSGQPQGEPGVAGASGKTGGGGQGGGGSGETDAHWRYNGHYGGDGTAFSGGAGGGGGPRFNGGGGSAGSDSGGAGGSGGVGGDVCYAGGGGGAGNGGGSGGSGLDCSANGASGQAGSPGTGGVLFLIVGGTLTIGAAGVVSANGSNGGNAGNSGGFHYPSGGGGGSGGGAIVVLHAGTLSNGGTIQANGGGGGSGAGNGCGWGCTSSGSGGAGGAGSIVIEKVKPA